MGFDFVHSLVDDHSRFAYSEILPNGTALSTTAFFTGTIDAFGAAGIHLQAVMTDNYASYTKNRTLRELLVEREIDHVIIKPQCPWQNGKLERFNRTLQIESAYRQPFDTNDERTAALAPWLHDYSYRRRHHALGERPPVSRLSPT